MDAVARTDFETEAVRLFAAGAAARGWRVEIEPGTRFCCRVKNGEGRAAFVIGADFGLNDSASRRVAQDKAFAAHFLRVDGLPAVETRVVRSLADEGVIAGFGWPVVVKPCRGQGGVGVSLSWDMEELVAAERAASAVDPVVVVQPFVTGKELRIAVLEGEHLATFEKARAPGKLGANLAQGGTWTDITESVDAGIVDLAVRATRSLGLVVSGVDLVLCGEGGVNEALILEVNATPGVKALGMHRPAALDRLIDRALDRVSR